ncbi:hypothetical protein P9112_005582 [Eukaryota sp. TZLM1-RC]
MNDISLQKFTDWINSYKCSTEYLDFRVTDSSRISVFANQDLEEGTVITDISSSLVFSSSSSALATIAKNEPQLQDIFDADPFAALALCVFHELSLGPSSSFHTYFSTFFPPSSTDSPIFWTTDEASLLELTSINVKEDKAAIEEIYNDLLTPIISTFPFYFSSPHFTPSIKQYILVGSFIQAYSFSDHNGFPYLLPLADALNARSGRSNVRVVDVEEDDNDCDCDSDCDSDCHNFEPHTHQIVATRPIKKGEEILNTYGDLNNIDCLSRYGYIDMDNPFTVAEIPLFLVIDYLKTLSRYNECFEFLNYCGFIPPQNEYYLCYEQVTPTEVPLNLLAFCGSMAVNSSKLKSFMEGNQSIDVEVIDHEALEQYCHFDVDFGVDLDSPDVYSLWILSNSDRIETFKILRGMFVYCRDQMAQFLNVSPHNLTKRQHLAIHLIEEQLSVLDELVEVLSII